MMLVKSKCRYVWMRSGWGLGYEAALLSKCPSRPAAGSSHPALRRMMEQSVTKQTETSDVRVIACNKEALQSPRHGSKFVPRRHRGILSQGDRDEEKEIVRVTTEVALPEVQQVHVVDGRLASFDLQQNS